MCLSDDLAGVVQAMHHSGSLGKRWGSGRLVHYANVNSGKATPPPSLYVTLRERRSSLKICLTMTVELAPAVVTAVLVAPALNSSICAHTLTPHTPHFRRAVEPHVAASASTGAGGAVEGGREE